MASMVDAYSSLCLGFAIGFEGGDKLLRRLIINVNSDKANYCRSLGIEITDEWPSMGLCSNIIIDNGSDYSGSSFTNLTDLGVQIESNRTQSPHNKPIVEKLYDLIQRIIKPYLTYEGVVNKDGYPEKPKDNAVLTLADLEKILVKAIVYYNSNRIITLPFGKEYLKPYANQLFIDSYNQFPNTFIGVTNHTIELVMMHRTTGKFTRFGLQVGKYKYRAYNYVNDFLAAKREVIVAYNPDDISKVWVVDDDYAEFVIINSFFRGKTLTESDEIVAESITNKKKYQKQSLEAKIKLGLDIEAIVKERKAKGGSK